MAVARWAKLAMVSLLTVTLLGPPSSGIAAENVTATSAPASSVLVARPVTVDFKTKRVGTENYKRTKITNKGPDAVRLVVTAGLPDDFGFGLLPGQTCPVFSPGEILSPGKSCYAVVRFSPSESFVGWQATGSLIATATDPGAPTVIVDELAVPVLGRAVS